MMPYKSLMANIIQVAAFNAILLNLVGAILLKVNFHPEDYGLGETFADGFLVLVNLTVPVLVLCTLAFSMGQDVYMCTVGRFVQGGFTGRSRKALLEAIAQRQHSQSASMVEGTKSTDKDNRSRCTDLSAESIEVSRCRQAFRNAEACLKKAEAELEEKREWYRFVQNHTKNAAEFHHMCQSETPQSFRRLFGSTEAQVASLSNAKDGKADDAVVSARNPMADADNERK